MLTANTAVPNHWHGDAANGPSQKESLQQSSSVPPCISIYLRVFFLIRY
jgi:hypothetical protein